MNGECAQCGRCCSDINSTTTPEQIAAMPHVEGRYDLAKVWTFITRKPDGRYHYACWYFNGKNCDIHDMRPEVCRGYPFYGAPEVGKQYLFDKDCAIYLFYKEKQG